MDMHLLNGLGFEFDSEEEIDIQAILNCMSHNISDLEGQLWLLTARVGVARNRERSDGLFPPHGYLRRTMPSARRED